MIPLGVLAGSRHVAAGGGALTLTHVAKTAVSGATWDGTHWNIPNVAVGAAGSSRQLILAVTHRADTDAPATVFVGAYEATLLAMSPIRAYAQLWSVTIGAEVGPTATIRVPDRTSLLVDILAPSVPLVAVDSGGTLAGSVVTSPSVATSPAGVLVAVARGFAGAADVSSLSGVTSYLVNYYLGTAETTGAAASVTANFGGSSNNAVVVTSFKAA